MEDTIWVRGGPRPTTVPAVVVSIYMIIVTGTVRLLDTASNCTQKWFLGLIFPFCHTSRNFLFFLSSNRSSLDVRISPSRAGRVGNCFGGKNKATQWRSEQMDNFIRGHCFCLFIDGHVWSLVVSLFLENSFFRLLVPNRDRFRPMVHPTWRHCFPLIVPWWSLTRPQLRSLPQ